LQTRPRMVTLVPEKREEITTEGGLDLKKNHKKIIDFQNRLHDAGILVSLFIEADKSYEKILRDIRPDFIEIHTGEYSRKYYDERTRMSILETFKEFSGMCEQSGIRVNAGHGLNYHNVRDIMCIEQIEELNIGHSIISRAVFAGLAQAVTDMKSLTGDIICVE
ncbi:MAG: pyridoxine 5'-phosphate synthase, partial [Candidatus Muiribacteriaceae bacterium]